MVINEDPGKPKRAVVSILFKLINQTECGFRADGDDGGLYWWWPVFAVEARMHTHTAAFEFF